MKNDSLAEFLRFNEDVEVGLFELLCEHTEDIRGGREVSQVVNDQVEQQLSSQRKTRELDFHPNRWFYCSVFTHGQLVVKSFDLDDQAVFTGHQFILQLGHFSLVGRLRQVVAQDVDQ